METTGTKHTKCQECNKEFKAHHGNCKFCTKRCYQIHINRRDKALKAGSRYGISGEEYEKRMATSDKCQICGGNNRLCYDHDHNTMEFRGVLCANCNKGLGNLGDDIRGITKALEYLKEHYEK